MFPGYSQFGRNDAMLMTFLRPDGVTRLMGLRAIKEKLCGYGSDAGTELWAKLWVQNYGPRI